MVIPLITKLASTVIPLIICGGAGTRLWPASREGRPKQFLSLFGGHSTFQDTVLRVTDQTLFGRPIVVTNNQYRFLVAEQLAAIGIEADVLLEPERRDSGPAIAAGAAFAAMRDENTLLVALAADGLCQSLPSCRRRCWRGSHRHLRNPANSAGDRIRLHSRWRIDWCRHFCG